MLKRFEVKNIKNFKEKFVLDFSDVHDYQFNSHCVKNGLLKNAIIFGKNAVGKSNLGMALFDIVATLTDENVHFYKYKFGSFFLNADSDCEYGEFSYTFRICDTDILYQYRKSDIDTIVAERLTINNLCIFDINFEYKANSYLQGLNRIGITTVTQEFKIGEMSFLRYIIKNTYLNDDSILKTLYRFVSGMLWARSFENNQLIPRKKAGQSVTQYLCENNLVQAYSEFLNKFGVKNEILIETQLDGKYALYFKHSNKNIATFDAASSGTLALTTLFFAMNVEKDITFLWLDEFDAFYHFELAESVINNLAKNYNFQVVCTSHNTDLLSNRIMRPDCYFILNNKRLVTLPNATDRELREGHNLEKMFQSGEFEDTDEES